MTFRNKGLVLAMEEENGEVVVAAPVEQEAVPAEVEQQVGEVVREETEVADLNTAIEEAVEDAETLSDVADVMEESVQSGEGLPEEAAKIAEVAVESICARLGIKNTKVIPAMESFGSSNSRLTATRIAVEGIWDAIKRAWEAIKNAFKSLWAKIVAFWKKLFDTNTKVKNSLPDLKKKIDALGNKKMQSPAFDNDTLAKAFCAPGKATSAALAEEVLGNHKDATERFVTSAGSFESAVKDVTKLIEQIEAAGKAEKQDGAANSKLAADVKEMVDGLGKDLKTVFSQGAAGGEQVEGYSAMSTGLLIEGKVLTLMVRTDEDAAKSYIKVAEVQVGKPSDAKVVQTLTADQMRSLVKAIGEVCDANEKLRQKQDYLGKFEKTMNNTIELAIKKVSALEGQSETKEGVKEGMTALRRATADIGNSIGAMSSKLPALSALAAKQAANYIGASLKQYKEAA